MGKSEGALGSRIVIDDEMVLVRGRHGKWLAYAADDLIPFEIARTGVWAPADLAVFDANVKRGDCVLELGGHIGHHAVYLARLIGPEGRLVVMDAQSRMARLLRINAAINDVANVTVIHGAVGDAGGTVSVYWVDYRTPANLGAVSTTPAYEGGERVPVIAIDELGLDRLDFVKCDVQGSEAGAILSGRRTIERLRPKIYCEIGPKSVAEHGRCYREIYDFLFGLGYCETRDVDLPTDKAGVPVLGETTAIEWNSLFLPP